MSNQWYKKGLNFACTGCGGCCTGGPGYVWVNNQEIEAIAAHLALPIETFKQNYLLYKDGRYSLIEKKNYDCIFLEGKKCTIYAIRPTQCRTFPWWPANLESPENWKNAAKSCEGIHQGAPIVSFDLIQKSLHQKF